MVRTESKLIDSLMWWVQRWFAYVNLYNSSEFQRFFFARDWCALMVCRNFIALSGCQRSVQRVLLSDKIVARAPTPHGQKWIFSAKNINTLGVLTNKRGVLHSQWDATRIDSDLIPRLAVTIAFGGGSGAGEVILECVDVHLKFKCRPKTLLHMHNETGCFW